MRTFLAIAGLAVLTGCGVGCVALVSKGLA